MKFAQLPIGAGFQFDERRYHKVSPLEAVDDATGARRLIRRSASIERFQEQGPEAVQPTNRTLRLEIVESVLNGCVRKVEQGLTRLSPALSDEQLIAVQALMRDEHAGAIARLRLGTDTDRGRGGNETADPAHPLGSILSTKGAKSP